MTILKSIELSNYNYEDLNGNNRALSYTHITLPDSQKITSIVYDLPGQTSGGVYTASKDYNNTHDISYITVSHEKGGFPDQKNCYEFNIDTYYYNTHKRGLNGIGRAYPKLAHDLMDEYNVEPNILYNGFSWGADNSVHMAAYHSQQYKDDNVYAVSINPDHDPGLAQWEKEALASSGEKVIYVYSQSIYHEKLMNAINPTVPTDDSVGYDGVKLFDVIVNIDDNFYNGKKGNQDHVLPSVILSEYGISNLASGGFDFNDLPAEYYYKGQTYSLSYEVYEYYTNENGEYVSRSLSLDEANKALSCGPYSSEVIQSDTEYLSQSLANIRLALSSLMNLNFKFGVTSSTAVPAREVALLNQLINTIKDLCEKMRKETETIEKIGTKFYELDIELDKETESLMSSFMSVPLKSKTYNSTTTSVEVNNDLEQLLNEYRIEKKK